MQTLSPLPLILPRFHKSPSTTLQQKAWLADEAAHVLDSNLWGIFEKYPHLTFKILVGDCYQLPPVVQFSQKTNPFYSQISLSVMVRLQAISALRAFLEEQMRGLPEMVEPYNAVTCRHLSWLSDPHAIH
jgi:hypothetical protein